MGTVDRIKMKELKYFKLLPKLLTSLSNKNVERVSDLSHHDPPPSDTAEPTYLVVKILKFSPKPGVSRENPRPVVC